MFCYCLFLFFYFSPFVLRNYSTDFHQIFRNCVFWCSLNNPVVLNLFWLYLADINAKNSQNLLTISRVDSEFLLYLRTVEDNWNQKQTWTRGIVSLHSWRISFWTIEGKLRSICSIGWENLHFFWLLHSRRSLKNYSDLHKISRKIVHSEVD